MLSGWSIVDHIVGAWESHNGQKNSKERVEEPLTNVFWHQSEARTDATIWNQLFWSELFSPFFSLGHFFCQFRVLRPHYLPLGIIINRYRSGIQQTTQKKVVQNFEVKFACKKETKDGSSENFIFESDLNIRMYGVFSLTWPASMQIYWNKRKRLHKKGVQLPQDWFGTPTWPPFHCFGTPIWPP